MRKLFYMLAAGVLLALAAPAYSQTGITVQIAPPAAQVETVPASPGGGAIWTPGYYRYDPSAQNYVWETGSWQVPPHHHMQWVAAHSIHRTDGSYEYFSGHWATKHQAHEEREAEVKMER